ncbi:DUF1853 family protein [uncultured Gimesia sp.]|uniref:DUF1853 family protein n=1 Tax=uncultured Gimesia sp. TaxID=1678688 RepID=UPI00263A2E31|nr:DUF1853 family protein [uncultured Gimesia sp.]
MHDESETEPTPDILESQYQRDLKWTIQSPSLIIDSQEENGIYDFENATSIDERELKAFLAPYAKFRVGQYFEGLVLYWLDKICHLKIVAQQQQIREGNQTIGEIDFLFEDAAGRLNHWETAVKFFLYYPEDNTTGSHFIGPNVSDWFEKKVKRLLQHQLPFGKKNFPEITLSKAFVKGMIFYHPHVTPPTQLPEKMSAAHLRGTWIHHSELSWLNDPSKERLFRVMHKPYWLSPEVSSSENKDQKSFEELKSELETHFMNKEWPVLISVLTCQQSICHEIDRVFVVAESWPQL